MTELDELRDEISTLKAQVKDLETRAAPTPQSNPSGTVAALSTLLLDPAYPRVSFGPNYPALQYPAQFKFEMSSAFGTQDILALYCKSQFTANQDWEQVASWGVSGGMGFTKTMFASNYIKFLPSGTGEADIGVDLAPFGTQLAGLIITGKSQTPGSTAPIIVLDGYVQQVGAGVDFYGQDGAISAGNYYLQFVAPVGGIVNPIIRSKSGVINISDLVLANITANNTVTAGQFTSNGNINAAATLIGAGLNVTNPASITFGSNWVGGWTPTITADAGTVSGVNIYNGAYLRIGPIVFLTLRWGMTLSANAGFIYITLPIAGPAAPNNFASMGSVLVETSPGGAIDNATLHFRFMNPGTQMVINEPTGKQFPAGSGFLMSGYGFYRCA